MTDRNLDEQELQELKERLRYLQDQLEDASKLDADDHAGLSQAADDIFQLIVHGRDKEVEAEHVSQLRLRLERYAAEFDAEHPRTSGVLRQIGATLERMGI